MSPAVYVIFAVLLSMFLGWLAVRVIMRNAAGRPSGRPSILTVVLAIASWGFLSFLALTMALSTTNVVQTAIIVSNMERNPPFRTIAASDPAEWARLNSAVSTGLENARDGDIRKSVIDAVSAELQPYMNRRLSTAPDRIYFALVPIVADGMRKSRTMGRCIVVGDRRTADLRHQFDPRRILEWSEEMIRTPSVPAPAAPGATELAARRRDLIDRAVQAGIPRPDAEAALIPDAPGSERCAVAARILELAKADTDRQRGAADVRMMMSGFQLPG